MTAATFNIPEPPEPRTPQSPPPPRTTDQPDTQTPPVLDQQPGYDRVDQSPHERRTHEQVSGLQHTCVRLDFGGTIPATRGQEWGGGGERGRGARGGRGGSKGAQTPGPPNPHPPAHEGTDPTRQSENKLNRILTTWFVLFVYYLSLFIVGEDGRTRPLYLSRGRGRHDPRLANLAS